MVVGNLQFRRAVSMDRPSMQSSGPWRWVLRMRGVWIAGPWCVSDCLDAVRVIGTSVSIDSFWVREMIV